MKLRSKKRERKLDESTKDSGVDASKEEKRDESDECVKTLTLKEDMLEFEKEILESGEKQKHKKRSRKKKVRGKKKNKRKNNGKMKSQKMQDEIVGKGNARTVDKSSKTSRMVKDYDVDDFEIANSGGDEALPPTPTQSMNSMSVKIPRPGRDSRNNSSEKLEVTEDFRVNNVDKNDVTLLASTGKENVPTNLVTEKNTHNEIPKAKLSQPAEEIFQSNWKNNV